VLSSAPLCCAAVSILVFLTASELSCSSRILSIRYAPSPMLPCVETEASPSPQMCMLSPSPSKLTFATIATAELCCTGFPSTCCVVVGQGRTDCFLGEGGMIFSPSGFHWNKSDQSAAVCGRPLEINDLGVRCPCQCVCHPFCEHSEARGIACLLAAPLQELCPETVLRSTLSCLWRDVVGALAV